MQTYIPHRCGGRNKGVARWAWRTHQHAQLVKKKGEMCNQIIYSRIPQVAIDAAG